ncbi:hypothetical protein PVAND_012465 [Polypedilum vanderplanki]|uniref:Selenoprotein K n=1 Tax=Polypedilum vanderplanki TaxID=319348 RepID=A0A9J6CMJ1_POLVA|nr:hypothetical protein PVAND_012465 [Polypedilum vanderplanki]
MPYVGDNGQLLEKPPFTKRIVLFFLGFWQFIIYFFSTLFGQDVTKGGPKYTREYRGRSNGPGGPGGPRPPQRRIGRFRGMSDISCSPMSGG